MARIYETKIRRFNGQDYDTLLPQPATHGFAHNQDGNDPLGDGSVGVAQLTNAFVLPVAKGGTGAETADNARKNLGVSNPNLLDNWWFGTGVVNQRGKTSWAYSSSNPASNYGVDRWKLTSGSAVVTSNGITLNGTLAQTLETAVGSNVTASIVMHSGTATVAYDNESKTFTITSSEGTIKAVKLEYGSTSTLANDNAPDYVTELNKCLYYYERLKVRPNDANITISNAPAFNTGTIYFPFTISPKRKKPILTGTSKLEVGTAGFNIGGFSSVTVFGFSENSGLLTFEVKKDNSFVQGTIYRLGLIRGTDDDSILEFSADL